MLELLYSSPTLVYVAVTLFAVYAVSSWLSHPSDLPPMPCTPVPFFGHILYFRPSMRDALMNWKDKVGDIYSIYIGSRLVIVINSYELLIESFIKQADKFSDRPLTIESKMWKEARFGITTNSGPSWKEQRTVSMSILREFGMGKNWLAEKISEEVEEYVATLENMKEEAMGLQILTNTALSNVVSAILLGQRFTYDDPFLVKFVQQNIEQFKILGQVATINAFPWLRFLPGDMFRLKKLMKNSFTLNELFSEKFIQLSKNNLDDTSTENFIKSYLREMNKRENTYLSETHLRRIIDALFIAGTDTTSTSILWALAFSVHHPDCQKKIYQEIVEEVDPERTPNMHDKPKLKYLNAFIMESQRIGSVAPLGLDHLCSQTTQVKGYRIPKGAVVIPHLDAVLKDEKVWKDPDTFRPERFLDKDGHVFVPGEFIPFSLGRRICLGESLAKMELFLFLSTIFQRFEVLPEDPSKLPALVSSIGLTSSLIPFKLRMKARLSS